MPAKRQIIATYVNTTCKTAPLLFGCFFTASVASAVLLLLLQAHSLPLPSIEWAKKLKGLSEQQQSEITDREAVRYLMAKHELGGTVEQH